MAQGSLQSTTAERDAVRNELVTLEKKITELEAEIAQKDDVVNDKLNGLNMEKETLVEQLQVCSSIQRGYFMLSVILLQCFRFLKMFDYVPASLMHLFLNHISLSVLLCSTHISKKNSLFLSMYT